MNILLCGGAGYIGSHVARRLMQSGIPVVIYDNLSTGHAWAVDQLPLVVGDIRDTQALDRLMASQRFDAVIHMAACSIISESVADPLKYYDNNVAGTLSLLQTMQRHSVDKIVFSSTAAVFGPPETERIDDSHPTRPINPYGASKLMVERMLADAASSGLRSVSLRYFNAAGADAKGDIGEAHQPETHLIPNAIMAALEESELAIYGTDYNTPDGSCIRDYVHVNDLAYAHFLSLGYLARHPGAHQFNLGNGHGFSIKEVIRAVSAISGKQISVSLAPRRKGDPAKLVASNTKAIKNLGWKPAFTSLDEIIASAWNWHAAQQSNMYSKP